MNERDNLFFSYLQHFNDALVDALTSIIEYRSAESGQHILRIRHFTQILLETLAQNYPEYRLSEQTVQIISSAAALHDIGKISIPDSILGKPDKLTAEEWDIMKNHTISGCKILDQLQNLGNHEYLHYAHSICHYHHERWDGTGYPEGLIGDDIPICAQVVGLADAYDALTTRRVYKEAISYKEAANMIYNGECGAFSPKLLACFRQVELKFEQLAQDYADGLSPKTENFDTELPPPLPRTATDIRTLLDRAEKDALTKLYNKHAAQTRVETYLATIPKGTICAFLIIDLDNFKQVNDQYGHMFGDAVLTQTANEIKRQFRSQDIISRIGGDEFMVFMRDVSTLEAVNKRCEELMATLRNSFNNQFHDCPLGCSIGIAFTPEHGTDYFELFQHADQALYHAKRSGKNTYFVYNSQSALLYKNADTAINERIDSNEQPGLADNSIVQYTFQQLYDSKNINTTINEILALIGEKMNVSRVYIFENNADNTTCSNTFEWCNTGISPENAHLQNIVYEDTIPEYWNNFNEKGIFYCPDINMLPRHLRDILEPQEIKSMLQCAILDKGVFRGYVGFDECSCKRLWTKEQIHILTYFSEMLSVFLLKKRAQDEIVTHVNNLYSILDNQNAWIYVIDPDSFELLFLNAKTKKLAPNASVGMTCYQAVIGKNSPCKNCPARAIKYLKNREQCIYIKRFQINVISEATLIQWEGKDACLITCRELK